MIYGFEAILLTDLDYGAPRVRVYNEQGAEASLEDAMDQLNEARDVTILCSAKYNKHYAGTTAIRCGVGPLESGSWYSALSRATRTATSSLRHGRDHTSLRRCSDQASTSSRPSTVESSSMPRTSSSYVIFTLNICMYP